ncbi:xanthine dehydrogenase family protein molybdopterin-binding subunit [Neorhizobium sp. DAR64872/K0K18]|uniref:xanthine dehydrogenase family protein molybdopterin-binding subunit n=1 Tax=Neorhizobium sp. DAR64872/K0K18 TaxID=3421958 RepID=UPI003D2C8067
MTGAAKYAADVYPAGTLHAIMVGSPVAAGTITAIDTRRAAAVRGVVAVFTHRDMPKLGKLGDPFAITHFPLQTTEIQWEGQTIALVVADTLEAAEEAAPLVRATIAPTTPLVPGKGKLETPPDGLLWMVKGTTGDPLQGFSTASERIEQSYFQPTRNHNPMETSACVARWDGDELTLWDSTQFSQNPVVGMEMALGIDKAKVRVIAPHTGGGFGTKGSVWPHEVLAAQAAKLTGRPVRLQLTRSQMYTMNGHQPECRQTITLGATADGQLTAMRHHAINTTSIADMQFEGPAMATRTYYKSPSIDIDQQVERVNLVRSCPMRAPVEGPGGWALESAMDELAIALGIDPLDLRLKNFADKEPFDGKPWSSNKLLDAYAEASEVFGWRDRQTLPKQDGVWTIGRGMSMASTFCARFPNEARVRVNRDGSVIAEASSNDIGTGIQTVVVLAVAEALGTDPSNVSFRWGDSRLPAAGPVYGSSHTIGMGSAVRLAALEARSKLKAHGAPGQGPLDLASLMSVAGVSEIVGEGKFGFPDDAKASMNGSGTPYAMQTWGANFVEIGVDRDLGLIRLRRVVARYSAGRIINPMAAKSQMIGGVIWEWGKATMEASVVEPHYGRFLAKNLSNVAVPVNADIPADAIDVGFIDEYDEHASLIGAKGIGELGSTGVCAAIANALYDAIGVRVREVPILPHHILDAEA